MSDPSQPPPDPQAGLQDIATHWSLLRMAHQDSVTAAGPARNALVLRYSRAIRQFMGALVPGEQEADDLAQEVVVRLLRGDFRLATPERGRFRDYLAVATRNMVRSYWQKKGRQPVGNADPDQIPDRPPGDLPSDEEMLASWRRSVLEMAWAALKEYQRLHPDSLSYPLLRLRTEYPEEDGEQLAARLAEVAGKRLKASALRQQLRRARLRFAQYLVEEIAHGLDDPTPQRVEEELIEIGLMKYVRDFLPPDWAVKGELRFGERGV